MPRFFPATTDAGASLSRYAEDIGNDIDTTFTVDHNLGSTDVLVSFQDNDDSGNKIETNWRPNGANAIIVEFSGFVPATDQVHVVVVA